MKPWQWSILALITIMSLLIPMTQDEPKAREASNTRFLIMKIDGSHPYYLTLDGKNQQFRAHWVVSPDMAFPFADRMDAQSSVDQFGGWVVPMKGEKE